MLLKNMTKSFSIGRRKTRRTASCLVAASLVAAALSGCGSDTTALQSQVESLQNEVDSLQNDLDIVIQDMLTLEDEIVKMQNGEATGTTSTSAQSNSTQNDASQNTDHQETENSGDHASENKEQSESDKKDSAESDQKNPAESDKKDSAEKTASAGETKDLLPAGNYASAHGALAVKDGKLVDAAGDAIALYGVSTHGLAWFPDYVNQNAFQTLRDDWGATCVRLAMYTAEYGGYCSGGNKDNLKNLVCSGVDAATNLGMYVIVDWHVLSDSDPTVYQSDAISFFDEISKKYKDQTNVIYEICNEPCNGCSWDNIYKYANAVIPVIRGNDEDAIILVGTPNWSQQIDKAAAKPLDYDNILYTMHFYAATHQQDMRNTLESYSKNGLPVFVSEFGMCDASGNGGNDLNQAQSWIDLLDQLGISYVSWNLSNKGETSALLSSSCQKKSGWSESDLSESGKWIRNLYRSKSFGN